MRKTEFANGEYYHIYNRGVDKREVFSCDGDYRRFIVGMNEFNNDLTREQRLRLAEKSELSSGAPELSSDFSPMVEIICYCLNPNHYHLILKQLKEKGIEKFMHKLSTGYTNYFNKKYSRFGSLFQGPFKSIHIDSNEYLLHLSVYVNANHAIHNYSEKDWPYSGYLDYAGKREGKLSSKVTILERFDNDPLEYEKFMQNNINYFREKKELEKYVLE
jgi:putative transposase